MATRKCTRCGQEKSLEQFRRDGRLQSGRTHRCHECVNAYIRQFNVAYTKTKKGFLMRVYRNMQSRVTGVQKQKFHLYVGKPLAITRDEFYEWGFTSAEFHELFAAWEASGYARQYTPSVDRIDSAKGYVVENMEWVTHSENSRRGNESRIRQGKHRKAA